MNKIYVLTQICIDRIYWDKDPDYISKIFLTREEAISTMKEDFLATVAYYSCDEIFDKELDIDNGTSSINIEDQNGEMKYYWQISEFDLSNASKTLDK